MSTKIICGLLLFGSGFVAALNLAVLRGINPSYDAEWWKVVVCVLFAALSIVRLCVRVPRDAK